MRKSLFMAAAAAPLALLATGPALAATTISDAHTTPVNTSTANGGQPDDVTITGSVTVSGPVAVTLDSNNSLTNSGAIGIKDVDNSAGALIKGGFTGSFANNGTITVNGSYTPTDSNGDGVVDGAFAQGTGRYGVRVIGPGAFTGTVANGLGATITVQGNNSYGLSAETLLQGDLLQAGSIAVTGTNTVGLRETSGVTGKVLVTGTISAEGGGAIGADMSGDIGGRLSVYSSVQSTGFRTITRNNDPTVNAKLLPEDLLTSGPALRIGGNVLGGVYIGAPPAGTVATDTTTDADGDGVVDSAEGTGTITTYGPGPALVVGASARDVHLGAFGAGDNAYGLIIRGSVSGSGVFDGFSGQAVQIGTGDGTVHIDGGVRIVGSVSTQGFEADATGVHLLTGAQAPQLRVDGTILTTATSAKASNATGILLDAGSIVSSLTNSGTINSSLIGDLGSASAVVDRSGTLSSVTNTNTITATITPGVAGDITHGRTIALDLSANTTGVSLVQNPNPASTTTTPLTPSIHGDILLGSGNDTVQIHAGTVTGALDFGGGQGSLLVDSGAAYSGRLLSSGVLNISVPNGKLQDDSPSTIQASSLNVGSSGLLVVSADPVNGVATRFNVTGPATIASGGRLGLELLSLLPGPQSYTVISSPMLSATVTDSDLSGQTPFLYVAGFHADLSAGTVTVNLRRRTAAEAGLNQSETSAYDAVYRSLALDPDIERAFLSQTDHAGLVGVLDQMLPDHAGGVFRALSWASEQQGVATGEPPVGQDQEAPTRAWTQEIVLSERKDPGPTAGYQILGFGAEGGIESVSAKGDALGVKFGFVTANVSNPDIASDNLLGVSELNTGVYWRGALGPLHADAQLGAGFIWANSRREFLFSDSNGVVHRTARGNWDGYSLSGRVGVQYTANLGSFFIQPRVHADYFRMHENGYTETGGGSGFDLAVQGRTGDVLSVTSSVEAGYTFGATGFRWRPQLEIGYRSVLSGAAGTTSAEFVGTSDTFSLAAETLRRGAAVGRIGLRVYSSYLDLLLDAGGEYNKEVTDVDVHLTARTVF